MEFSQALRSPPEPKLRMREILDKMEEYRSFPCEVIEGGLGRPPVEFSLEGWTPIVRQADYRFLSVSCAYM